MAKAETISLIQFQKEFSTEEACADYLISKRWKNGFSCPKCSIKSIIVSNRASFMSVVHVVAKLRLPQELFCIKPSNH